MRRDKYPPLDLVDLAGQRGRGCSSEIGNLVGGPEERGAPQHVQADQAEHRIGQAEVTQALSHPHVRFGLTQVGVEPVVVLGASPRRRRR